MTNQVRGSITTYLDLSMNNEKMDKLVKDVVYEQNKTYPHFKRSFDILKKHFDFIKDEQKFFQPIENRRKI